VGLEKRLSLRRAVLILAVALAATAALLAVSGGFRTTVGGLRVSARSPIGPAVAAFGLAALWFALARRERAIAADLETFWSAVERHASRLIGVIALGAALTASVFATRSASGADASGYLSQALVLHQGKPFLGDELGRFLWETFPDIPWDGWWLTTPLGWRPGLVPGLQAPTYPPGLPMLLAWPMFYFGIEGVTAVIAASAALAVWATGAIAGGVPGVIAALLLATSPAFLYQSIQPMSDVPVTAAWLLCFLMVTRTQRSFDAGIVCALAVLIRPNLAPLALVPLAIVAKRLHFAIPVIVAGAFLAFMHNLWYGSPLRSGYGSTEELFAISNVGPNAVRYFNWMVATSPVLFLAPFGMARLRHDTKARALAIFAALVIAAYLIYAVFDQWDYLRFLLPAMAVFAIFAGIDLAGFTNRWPVAARFPIVLVFTLGITAYGVFVAREFATFRLADQLARVEKIAGAVNRSAPDTAVLIAGEQSGAMRLYTARSILRWESASPEHLSRAVAKLTEAGRAVYIVLDGWEEALFRAKFAGVREVSLDWPPMAEGGTSHRTKVWRLDDRASFLKGEHISTIRLP
jgi:hypothetical protein